MKIANNTYCKMNFLCIQKKQHARQRKVSRAFLRTTMLHRLHEVQHLTGQCTCKSGSPKSTALNKCKDKTALSVVNHVKI